MNKKASWFRRALFPDRCLISHKLGSPLSPSYQDFPPAPQNQVSFQHLDQIYVRTAYYDPIVRKVVERFKFQNNQALGPPMARAIIKQIPSGFVDLSDVFVPIPLHWRRKIFRGYNQSLTLTKALQKFYPQNQASLSLKRIRATNQQSKLSRSQRLRNLDEAFCWKSHHIPRKVILIDDVVASGSTLEAAAKTLKEAGVKEVKAIVFARGGR